MSLISTIPYRHIRVCEWSRTTVRYVYSCEYCLPHPFADRSELWMYRLPHRVHQLRLQHLPPFCWWVRFRENLGRLGWPIQTMTTVSNVLRFCYLLFSLWPGYQDILLCLVQQLRYPLVYTARQIRAVSSLAPLLCSLLSPAPWRSDLQDTVFPILVTITVSLCHDCPASVGDTFSNLIRIPWRKLTSANYDNEGRAGLRVEKMTDWKQAAEDAYVASVWPLLGDRTTVLQFVSVSQCLAEPSEVWKNV